MERAREGSGERGSGSQETCPSARGPSPSREGRRAMVHRPIGGIAAVLLLLVSCGESAPPQAEPTDSPSPVAAFPVTIDGGERRGDDRRAAGADRLALADGDRDAVRDRCRRSGRGRRRPVELPVRGADDRPVGVRAERRGDRLVRAGPGRLLDRAGRPRRVARRRSASRRFSSRRRSRSTTCTTRSSSSVSRPGTSPRRRPSSRRCATRSTSIAASIEPPIGTGHLLPRARRHLLLGHVVDVHRPAVLAGGPREHRGRSEGRGRRAIRSSRPSTSWTPTRT